jgi:hypothetical protein
MTDQFSDAFSSSPIHEFEKVYLGLPSVGRPGKLGDVVPVLGVRGLREKAEGSAADDRPLTGKRLQFQLQLHLGPLVLDVYEATVAIPLRERVQTQFLLIHHGITSDQPYESFRLRSILFPASLLNLERGFLYLPWASVFMRKIRLPSTHTLWWQRLVQLQKAPRLQTLLGYFHGGPC